MTTTCKIFLTKHNDLKTEVECISIHNEIQLKHYNVFYVPLYTQLLSHFVCENGCCVCAYVGSVFVSYYNHHVPHH